MAKNCEQCGTALDEPQQPCPVCLMQLGVPQPPAETQGWELPSLEQLNDQFPQFEVTRLIGRGGMGAIYQARQTALDRDVALKIIAREVSGDTSFLDRFEREAKVLAKLSHPNIVTIYDYGHTPDGIAYLVMEYVDGINLRDALNEQNIEPAEALDLVATICRALEYAHGKGVVHRDIKPENILLGENGSLKVADFGIAKIVDDSLRSPMLTATRQVLGTLHYLAPEHIEAPRDVDHRVDLYAVGVIFYELLTGQLPLGRYDPPSSAAGKSDPRIDPIVLKSLSRRPKDRYQSAAELEQAIHQVRQMNTAPESDSTEPPASISVPFTCDHPSGFAEAVGMLYSEDSKLIAEFCMQDSIFGGIKSKTHSVEMRPSDLLRLDLIPGLFTWRLNILAKKMSTLKAFPKAETGRVELKIKRADAEFAKRLVRSLGFESARNSLLADLDAQDSTKDPNRVIFSVLLVLCCVMNWGTLAIAQVFFAAELRGVELAAAVIASAVTIAPIAILQLLTAILNLTARPKSLNKAACIVSMLPLTPVWILSFPLALWTLRWSEQVSAGPATASKGIPAAKSWGATTIQFIRENRWSKFVAVVNLAGLILFIAALGVYRVGLYPVELRTRIVGADVDSQELRQAVLSRMGDLYASWNTNSTQPQSANLRILQRNVSEARERLAIARGLQIAWIDAAKANTAPAADSVPGEIKNASDTAQDGLLTQPGQAWIAAASELPDDVFATSPRGLGRAVLPVQPPLNLSTSDVQRVRSLSNQSFSQNLAGVRFELTAAGREKLADTLPANPDMILGLIIDGLLSGYAKRENISVEAVEFTVVTSEQITPNTLLAALRGPELPCELEFSSSP